MSYVRGQILPKREGYYYITKFEVSREKLEKNNGMVAFANELGQFNAQTPPGAS